MTVAASSARCCRVWNSCTEGGFLTVMSSQRCVKSTITANTLKIGGLTYLGYKNILIKQHQTPEGGSAWWVKLADFGISKRVREASGATTVMGTEEYIAPELRRRNPADGNSIDFPATDIWSVGAMAFFILTGTPAFYSAWETFNYIQTPDTLFPRARLEHYHVTLVGQAIIRALMEPRPDQRLTARAAILHDWIWPCIPSDPVAMISSARSRYVQNLCRPASEPSSSNSLLLGLLHYLPPRLLARVCLMERGG